MWILASAIGVSAIVVVLYFIGKDDCNDPFSGMEGGTKPDWGEEDKK